MVEIIDEKIFVFVESVIQKTLRQSVKSSLSSMMKSHAYSKQLQSSIEFNPFILLWILVR